VPAFCPDSPIAPEGASVPDADRKELENGLNRLAAAIDERYQGKIVLAGFFGEKWEMLDDFGHGESDPMPLSVLRPERRPASAAAAR
jgi:hypothetical protein